MCLQSVEYRTMAQAQLKFGKTQCCKECNLTETMFYCEKAFTCFSCALENVNQGQTSWINRLCQHCKGAYQTNKHHDPPSCNSCKFKDDVNYKNTRMALDDFNTKTTMADSSPYLTVRWTQDYCLSTSVVPSAWNIQ